MDGARRVFHAVPVVFKGSGFYVNDYGKGSSTDTSGSTKKGEASEAGDGASEGSPASKDGSEGSSESKSQAGSETAAAASKSS